MDNTQPRAKSSMSVPEMCRLLGLCKTESYWLVKKNYFKTVIAAGHIRILIAGFEEWYANQFTYEKVDGTPPGAALQETTMSLTEMAQTINVSEATAQELLGRTAIERIFVYGRRRIVRSSFEEWYQSQSFYQSISDCKTAEQLYGATITMPEIARMLGVHRNTIYYLVKTGHFETIKTTRTTLVKRDSFESWYQGQNKYKKSRGGNADGIYC